MKCKAEDNLGQTVQFKEYNIGTESLLITVNNPALHMSHTETGMKTAFLLLGGRGGGGIVPK